MQYTVYDLHQCCRGEQIQVALKVVQQMLD